MFGYVNFNAKYYILIQNSIKNIWWLNEYIVYILGKHEKIKSQLFVGFSNSPAFRTGFCVERTISAFRQKCHITSS